MAHNRKDRTPEENEFHELLGDRIKMFRIAKGLTKADIAIDLRTSNNSLISGYEKGTCVPSIYRLYQIAKILEVELIDLIPEI